MNAFLTMLEDAEREKREFIGPVEPLNLEHLFKAMDEIGVPLSEAPPEAIAAVLCFDRLATNIDGQDSKNN